MWPFKARTQEEDDEFEGFETWEQQAPAYGQPYGTQPYGQPNSGFSDTWGEEEEWEGESKGIGVKALLLLLAGLLYVVFLAIGALSTDYSSGRGYVVPAGLRAERSYVSDLRPYYDVLIRVPDAAANLEKTESNPINLQYQLQQLQKAVSNFMFESKRLTPPAPYAAYQEFLVTLADKESQWLHDLIAYHQDKKAERLGALQKSKNDILYLIKQAKEQMGAIDERLVSNQK